MVLTEKEMGNVAGRETRHVYRQGDVLIFKIDVIPVGAKSVEGLVLAHGEATGHKHQIIDAEGVKRYVADRLQYLAVKAKQGVEVQHEEHSPIILPPGNYAVIIQVEYEPAGLRSVMD